jgi:cation/acetate symporter
MASAFIGIWLFSMLDRSKSANAERESFDAQFVRSETGIGAATAHMH